ncbi:MAG: DEAD/DEAH box helicase, partial [Bacteriovoracaceae bacterium]|nr:DEAD/DEAH box helicase [Bacteriovoracaceae bacterium]
PNLAQLLRPYQQIGHHWLCFLYEHRLGACLADDMGLGKTVQAISFLQYVYPKVKRILIVCPLTLLLNWSKEFKKFSSLTPYIYHGGERSLPPEEKIILTSYGVIKKDAAVALKDELFDILIMDEVQHLKNLHTLGAKAARMLQANFRICLTGTPVENNLAEFFNILDLSLPGLWGDLKLMQQTVQQDLRFAARQTASPFILRRTKAQVLQELPPKQENIVYLEFSPSERLHYQRQLQRIRNQLAIAKGKMKYSTILQGLLKLRQCCLWQKGTSILSRKIDFLLETITSILGSGHQAIIFSQFTTYLDIIQNAFKAHNYNFSRIDGTQSIKKRQQQVDLFQEGKNPLFLISLKAGGVGLNLTAASYVFIMDPWWNPAVENQAIDRAHRIGQKNTLTVYRPVIKDTVEEKILDLQNLKRQLFQDLFPDQDEQYFMGRLTMKDFELFFK